LDQKKEGKESNIVLSGHSTKSKISSIPVDNLSNKSEEKKSGKSLKSSDSSKKEVIEEQI